MSKIFFVFALFILFLSCSNEQNSTSVKKYEIEIAKIEKDKTVELTTKNFNKWLNNAGDSLSIVCFFADWCQVCKELKPVLYSILLEEKQLLRIGLVNVDREKNLVSNHGIASVPTLKFYKKNRLVYSSVGLLKEKELTDFLIKLRATAL